MEERLIDEEYGRGIKLKKTEDGYVDVTDAALDEETEGEEISFEFPVFDEDEDDEDLVGLSPEAALELRRKKEEAALARRAEYDKLCGEGDKLLEKGSFKAAELKFERAMSMDEKAVEATVGYWRAKTADFDEAEVLVEEYAEEGTENLEYDLGHEAIAQIGETFHEKLLKKYDAVSEEEKTLAEKVTAAQDRRRGVINARCKKTGIAFGIMGVVTVALLILSIYFGSMNYRVNDGSYIVPTIVMLVVFVVFFVAFGVCTNKFVNAMRMYRANERLSSTEEGARVVLLRNYKEIYEFLLK